MHAIDGLALRLRSGLTRERERERARLKKRAYYDVMIKHQRDALLRIYPKEDKETIAFSRGLLTDVEVFLSRGRVQRRRPVMTPLELDS